MFCDCFQCARCEVKGVRMRVGFSWSSGFCLGSLWERERLKARLKKRSAKSWKAKPNFWNKEKAKRIRSFSQEAEKEFYSKLATSSTAHFCPMFRRPFFGFLKSFRSCSFVFENPWAFLIASLKSDPSLSKINCIKIWAAALLPSLLLLLQEIGTAAAAAAAL